MRRPRVDDWSRLLREAVERHRALPFRWGVSDCGIMASDCVRAVTGFDPLRGIRYVTKGGVIRAFREAGYASATDLVSASFAEIDPAHAMRGDLGLPADVPDDLMSPAIIMGDVAISKNQVGPVVIPRSMIARAWAV